MSFAYKKRSMGLSGYKLVDMPVFFEEECCLPVIEQVLDEGGNIVNFPGIRPDARFESKLAVGMHRDVRYEAQFFPLEEDRFLMLWLLQPDGMYWADEFGFGMDNDESICLYTTLSKSGEFEAPFKLYSIGGVHYCEEYDK